MVEHHQGVPNSELRARSSLTVLTFIGLITAVLMIGRPPAATEPPTACDIGPVGKGSLSWAIRPGFKSLAAAKAASAPGSGVAATASGDAGAAVEHLWSDTELQ